MMRGVTFFTRSFATKAKKLPFQSKPASKIYELRSYTIKPEFYPDFLKLTGEKIHLRAKHSPFLGYWTSELGGINEVIHLWEYDSLAQRQNIRNALVKDKELMETYMSKMRPMLDLQENNVLVPMTANIVHKFEESDDVDLPVYELNIVAESDEMDEQDSNKGRESFGGVLVGQWASVIGSTSGSVVQIWRYHGFDTIDEFLRSAKNPIESQTFNKLIIPTTFSPLQ